MAADLGGFWRPGSDRPPGYRRPPIAVGEDEGNDDGGEAFFFRPPPSSASASSSYTSGYMGLEKERQRLPIYKHRLALLYLVERHATTVVVGETGCGKSTQIPQYLVEAGWAEGGRCVACTQPRRVAAQTVAARVAEEMRVPLGREVGYTIRFEDASTKGVTKLKYLTDGTLLREMMEDPLLTCYSVVMVDEAHERSVSTDILLGLLKKIQRRRKDLRLIIASATLEARSIAAFFDLSRDRKGTLNPNPNPNPNLSVTLNSQGTLNPSPNPNPNPSVVFNSQGALNPSSGSSPSPSLVQKGGNNGEEVGFPNKKPAVISVEGRSFSVQLFYLEEPTSDYVRAVVSAVTSIHQNEPPGDILAFLTGQDDVSAIAQSVIDEVRTPGKAGLDLLVLQLYAGLPRSEQELVFGPTPRGKRKVIFATNIAETSVTIDGVAYVVDSGFSKQRFYNPLTDMEALVTAPISRASAKQRAGRAGRLRPGKCYRLYTEETFTKEMSAETLPEIQRSSLVSTVLQLKSLGIDNIMRFDWLASPPPEAMIRALEVLYAIGVLDTDAKLASPTGFQIAEIPLDPLLSKMLLASAILECSAEVLTIAAALSVPPIWLSSKGRQKELDEIRNRFAVAEGDHVTYLNVYEGFRRAKKPPQWCHSNCLNYQSMKKLAEVRAQLSRSLQRLGLAVKSCGGDMVAVRKAIASGFFLHACQLKVESSASPGCYQSIRGRNEVFVHPSSVLFRVTPKWVVYHSLIATDRHYMRDVTVVDSAWLTEVAPHFFKRGQNVLPQHND